MKKKRSLKRCLFLLVILLVVGSVFYIGKLLLIPVSPALTAQGEEVKTDIWKGGRVNLLAIGADADGTRGDTLMLASLSATGRDAAVLSIPRDTRVRNAAGRYDKINHALGYNSREEALINEVKELTGLPVHYYITVGFNGFANVIDMLGGVSVDVPRDMKYTDPYQDLEIDLKKGYQHLDGKKAEQFVRYRSGYAEGDMGRVRAQQSFFKALAEQKLNPSIILKLPGICDEIAKNVKTNLTGRDILMRILPFMRLKADSISFHTVPGDGEMLGGVSYFMPYSNQLKELIDRHFIE